MFVCLFVMRKLSGEKGYNKFNYEKVFLSIDTIKKKKNFH